VIDSDDDNWADLLVWTDDNHDGISQAEELHTLDDLLITSISLDFDYVNYDINGNTIKQASTFEIDGHTHDIADVWFAYNTVNTVVSGGYTLDLETLSLPFQRGYGLLPSLHIAMSIDGDLKDMVSDLASKTAADLFDSEYDLRGAITAIMYQWAGVQDVDPDSRSEDFPESELDARQLGFLEHVMGEPLWHDPEADPGGTVYPYICQAWNDAFSLVATNLLAQSGLWDVLGNPVYNLSTDTLTGGVFDDPSILRFVSPFTTVANTLGTDFNDIFVLQAGDSPVASAPLTIDESAHPNTGNAILFGGVDPGDVYLWTDTYGNMTVRFSETDEVYVTGGIDNSGVLILDYLQKVMFSDGTVWDFSNGLHLILPTNEFYAYGSAFGDTIEGSSASDQLYGYDGNDVLISHGGGDYLVGGAGNDTYVITGEGESITESAGTDTIIGMPDGAHVRTDAYGDLIFFDPSTGDAYATVYGTYSSTTGITVNVEHVTFEDSSTMDLTGGLTLYTTDQNGEYLFGTGYGDTLTAGGGYGDHLYGYGGADHLVAGDATAMTGGAGADTFVFSSMSTTATVSDFNDGDGDKIDIASILSGYFDPEMDDAEDFVAIVESSGGSLVQVDLDGAGTGYSMATVATLSGVTGLDDVATLVSNGTLIVSHA
jgi:Ca2+-binding RTX toxin-like protein